MCSSDLVTGYIDLALERCFIYRPGRPSEQVAIPGDLQAVEAEARFHMLEQIADFDDTLLEQLLSDVTPPRDAVFADLVAEMNAGQITPVFFGSALNGFGVREATFSFYFSRVGLPVHSAVLLSLVAAALWMLFSLSGAAVYVVRGRH